MSEDQDPQNSSAQPDPTTLDLQRDQRGRLVLRAGDRGEPVVGVRLARCFPWSRSHGRYISIRDQEGNELCLLRSLDEVRPEVRRLIEDELQSQEFVPRILAILQIDDQSDVSAWKVTTDRGPIELQVKTSHDIRRMDDGRIIIRDHAGGLFELPDINALDPASRRRLEDHLG